MSTNTSTTQLPENFTVIEGVTLHLRDHNLQNIPTDSTLRFFRRFPAADGAPAEEVTVLTGMTATQVADAINNLPKDFHEDGQAAVPGRARNLVSSAIEDGWVVTITVRFKQVRVDFYQPIGTMQKVLLDLVAKVNAGRNGRDYTVDHITQGSVTYGWDYDADAMRMEQVRDDRLTITREWARHDGNEIVHRAVLLKNFQASDQSYGEKLTWKTFTDRIHHAVPSHVEVGMVLANERANARAQADAAFDAEAHTVTRDSLRDQLTALREQALGRREVLKNMPAPGIRSFRATTIRGGASDMAERAAKYEAEGELADTVKDILQTEGDWSGDERLHIDQALTQKLTGLTQRLLSISTRSKLVIDADAVQDVFATGHVISSLSPLVRVTIGTEVVV